MVQKNTMLESDQILYWLLFVPPGHATPLVSTAVALDEPSLPAIFYWLGALWFGFLVAASTFEPVVTLSISLRRGWLYPLSQTHLARVAYRGGLMQSATALGSMAILYCLLAMLSLSIAGQRFSYDFVPSFVLALALAVVDSRDIIPGAHHPGRSGSDLAVDLSPCGKGSLCARGSGLTFATTALSGVLPRHHKLPGTDGEEGVDELVH